MKKIQVSLILFITILFRANAQESNEIIYIEAENFSQEILIGWVKQYNELYPAAGIQIADKDTPTSTRVSLVTEEKEENLNSFSLNIPVARYALLPVSNEENPLLKELGSKSLDKNRVRRLFFEQELEEEGKYPFKNESTVYSGSYKQANAGLIADYFNKQREQLRGKKIAGDDKFLTHAVRKDPNGIAFNYITYLYDIQTRQLEEGLTLLPIDLKKDQWQTLNQGLDETLQLLEEQKVNLVPIYTLSLSFDKNMIDRLQGFIEWVLSEGQTFNHQYGFLNVEEKQKLHIQKQMELASLASTNR